MIKEELIDYLDELFPSTSCFLNHSYDYQLLLAVVLSSQTTDKKVNAVTSKLFAKYKTIEELANASYSDIYKIILPLGLAKNKTSYIISICNTLICKFNSHVPDNRDDLLSLDGVGYKTASVVLGELYDKKVIPVDTHIKRISKRLELSKNDSPNLIETDLENLFPTKGINFHRQLILFGRNICTSRNPKCKTCKLASYCKYYFSLKTN